MRVISSSGYQFWPTSSILTATELGERLDRTAGHSNLPGVSHQTKEDTPIGLLTLELSLDKLHTTARKLLPRLGIFSGERLKTT
jgi:hypothetical protein